MCSLMTTAWMRRKRFLFYSWVYIRPDIDQANLIYAWSISPKENQKLLDYYPSQHIWYIQPYKEKK